MALSDEYLEHLEDQGFDLNPHQHITAIDPPGHPARRWRCNYCGMVDLYDNLHEVHCTYEYPPCSSCGKTPECAPDCRGIMDALTGEGVCVIGFGREHLRKDS